MKYIKTVFFIALAFVGTLQADNTSYFNIDGDNSHHIEITLPEEFRLSPCKRHNDIHIDHEKFPEAGMIMIQMKKPGENMAEQLNKYIKNEIPASAKIDFLDSTTNLFTKLPNAISARATFINKGELSLGFILADTESHFCFVGLMFNGDLKELQELAQVVANGINLVPNK